MVFGAMLGLEARHLFFVARGTAAAAVQRACPFHGQLSEDLLFGVFEVGVEVGPPNSPPPHPSTQQMDWLIF